ncbi:MAG TPA: hypothetical protein VEC12_14110 [Bacteroidia bacterium]|nr:hypothetical protein [Bacteroidia bacterium]
MLTKVYNWVSNIFIISAVVLLPLCKRNLENIVIGKRFVLIYMLASLVFMGCVMWLAYLSHKEYFKEDSKDRGRSIVAFGFGFTICLLIGFAELNKHTVSKRHIKTAVMESKGKNMKYGTSYIHLLFEGRRERFSPRPKEYDAIASSDTIYIETGKGILGFEYIFEFKPAKNNPLPSL